MLNKVITIYSIGYLVVTILLSGILCILIYNDAPYNLLTGMPVIATLYTFAALWLLYPFAVAGYFLNKQKTSINGKLLSAGGLLWIIEIIFFLSITNHFP